MEEKPIWNTFEKANNFPELRDVLHADVSIIGGGITGITTAYFLKKAGYEVAVLEAGKIGMGTTGHSTGNLYLIVDELLSSLESKYDEATTKTVLKARASALEIIERIIQDENIDCDYKEQPMYLFSNKEKHKIEKEIAISSKIGISNLEVAPNDFPYTSKNILKYPYQAQFNPFLYVDALAGKLNSEECQIFQDSKVEKIEKLKLGTYCLKTARGSVSSRFLVHATHSPKGIDLKYDTNLGSYREYAIAATLSENKYPSGIYWEYKGKEKFSFRSYERNGQAYLLAVGKSYKVGQARDNKELLSSLEKYIKEKFPVDEITHFWGGQNYKPTDLLPFIGRKSEQENEFLATGFAADGLIYGSLAGKIITDLITEEPNEYQEIFDPLRVNPVKSAKTFVKENLNVAKEFISDHLLKSNLEEVQKLEVGEGKVMEVEGQKLAVFRNENKKYEIVSANCSHLGCVVHWNNLEKTWDCPCHGSRFKTSGKVIEGPAIEDLSEKQIKL